MIVLMYMVICFMPASPCPDVDPWWTHEFSPDVNPEGDEKVNDNRISPDGYTITTEGYMYTIASEQYIGTIHTVSKRKWKCTDCLGES